MKYFIGISIGANSTQDSGLCVVNEKFEILNSIKMYSINDLTQFLDNFSSLKDSIVCASLPEDMTMLNAKWKVIAKHFLPIRNEKKIKNVQNWTNRYSSRGSECLNVVKEKGIPVYRFEIRELKKMFNLFGIYKERTTKDCKNLQDFLKYKLQFKNMPPNMLPVAQLEALLGSYLAFNIYKNQNFEINFSFNDVEVVNLKKVD